MINELIKNPELFQMKNVIHNETKLKIRFLKLILYTTYNVFFFMNKGLKPLLFLTNWGVLLTNLYFIISVFIFPDKKIHKGFFA